MRKVFARIATAVFTFAALAIAAKAQTPVPDQLVIQIPYSFVVAGKTLPAGNYRVHRINSTNDRQLLLSSFENKVSVILLPWEVEDAREDTPGMSFGQINGQRFLSKIETAEHVFEIAVPKGDMMLADAKSHSGSTGPASGTD